MDEVTLLRRFRADVDPADTLVRARARALLLDTIASASAASVRRPPGLSLGRPGRLVLVAAAIAAVGAGIAAAATHWLAGEPAPPSVVAGFGSYAPQLGFHPKPGSAVLVARDDDLWLYATTNKESTYCILLSAPWKRPERLTDGGSCVPAAQASAPLTAGIHGISAAGEDGKTRFVFAGRTSDAEARSIRLTTPKGDALERPIGSSGFFVIGVRLPWSCAQSNGTSTIRVLDSDGEELISKAIALPQIIRARGGSVEVCGSR
jgi:hypothetical protein